MLRMIQVIWNRPLSSLSRQWVSKISVKAPREVAVLNYVTIFNIVQTIGESVWIFFDCNLFGCGREEVGGLYRICIAFFSGVLYEGVRILFS